MKLTAEAAARHRGLETTAGGGLRRRRLGGVVRRRRSGAPAHDLLGLRLGRQARSALLDGSRLAILGGGNCGGLPRLLALLPLGLLDRRRRSSRGLRRGIVRLLLRALVELLRH